MGERADAGHAAAAASIGGIRGFYARAARHRRPGALEYPFLMGLSRQKWAKRRRLTRRRMLRLIRHYRPNYRANRHSFGEMAIEYFAVPLLISVLAGLK